ncbi:MAG: beta-mannanase [Chloroflexi bacterium]|nr:beta-mannanase [Chloroflexota bacterium]
MQTIKDKILEAVRHHLLLVAVVAVVLAASSITLISRTASQPAEEALASVQLTSTEVAPSSTALKLVEVISSATAPPPTPAIPSPTSTGIPPSPTMSPTRVLPTPTTPLPPTPVPPTATPPPPAPVPPTATPRPPTPAPPPPPPPAPAASVALGAWVPGVPNNMAALTSFQNMVGKKMGIVMWYQGWVDRSLLNQGAAQTVANQGSTPLVSWEPWDWTNGGPNQPAYSNASIIAGNWDGFITSYAQSVKSFGRPVYLRFAHEMNVPSRYPWAAGVNGNTPQSYVAAWRRVHDIFAGVGANNVQWVWSPNVKYAGTTPFANVYPGDAYVDWLALDGYNGGTALPWGGWQSFSQIFTASYQDLRVLSGKPIMIAESASVEQGGSKAGWITDAMLTQLPQNFPGIRAFIWFGENRAGEADWRIESSSTSLTAFANAAANSYYR